MLGRRRGNAAAAAGRGGLRTSLSASGAARGARGVGGARAVGAGAASQRAPEQRGRRSASTDRARSASAGWSTDRSEGAGAASQRSSLASIAARLAAGEPGSLAAAAAATVATGAAARAAAVAAASGNGDVELGRLAHEVATVAAARREAERRSEALEAEVVDARWRLEARDAELQEAERAEGARLRIQSGALTVAATRWRQASESAGRAEGARRARADTVRRQLERAEQSWYALAEELSTASLARQRSAESVAEQRCTVEGLEARIGTAEVELEAWARVTGGCEEEAREAALLREQLGAQELATRAARRGAEEEAAAWSAAEAAVEEVARMRSECDAFEAKLQAAQRARAEVLAARRADQALRDEAAALAAACDRLLASRSGIAGEQSELVRCQVAYDGQLGACERELARLATERSGLDQEAQTAHSRLCEARRRHARALSELEGAEERWLRLGARGHFFAEASRAAPKPKASRGPQPPSLSAAARRYAGYAGP